MESKALSELRGLIRDLTHDLKQVKAAFTALKAFSGVKHGAPNGEAVALSYREFTGAMTTMRRRLDRIAHIAGVSTPDCHAIDGIDQHIDTADLTVDHSHQGRQQGADDDNQIALAAGLLPDGGIDAVDGDERKIDDDESRQ